MPEEHKELCIKNALGWVKMEATSLFEQQLPCAISYDSFHAEMTAYLEKLRSKTVLPPLSSAPTASQLALLKTATFVRQLRAIDSEDDDILEAMNDFFLAASDRVDYINKGWVSAGSFTELETALKRVWRDSKKAIGLEGQLSDAKLVGQKLYVRCKSHKDRVQGMDPPAYFIPGSFHQLADEPSIGWHPQYEELMKKEND